MTRRCIVDTIKLWARNGDAVRQAIELGELVHLDTASEELTDEFLLFAIQSGLLSKWAEPFLGRLFGEIHEVLNEIPTSGRALRDAGHERARPIGAF
jgi:hypothetical protein